MDYAKGMKVYGYVLQSARMQKGGSKIGPGHHMYDEHFKKWCEGKSKEEIEAALQKQKSKQKKKISQDEAKAVLNKTGEVKQAVSKAVASPENVKKETASKKTVKTSVAVSKTVGVTKPKDADLKEKWRKMQIQKLADALKGDGRLDEIKSVGNGL